LYALPATDDPDSLESTVYLQCQTLIPGSVVLVVTAFLNPDLLDAQILAVEDVTGTIDTSAVTESSFSESDLEQVMRLTGIDIDSFWATTFEGLDQAWVNPKFITFGEPIETDCGDVTPLVDGPLYCPSDQTVYLDQQSISGEMLPLGMVVVQFVLAHEIGHHVQNLLNLQGCTTTECGDVGGSLAIELQADCLAGAWMQDAAARQYVRSSDLKRVEVGVKDYFGDPPGTSQDDPDAHGDGDTRYMIFMDGYTNGISACAIT